MATRQLHKLSARFAETTMVKGRHGDGGNLFLAVGDGGARSWVYLYRERTTGRLTELGLGPAKGPRKEGFTLAEAREKAADARRTRLGGLDPLASKKADRSGSNTFGAFSDELLAEIKGGFKNPKTEADWTRALEVHCLKLRPLRLNAINTDHVLVLLRHKFIRTRRAVEARQHGHRGKRLTRASMIRRRTVAIEFGTWRSGRNGGSSGSVTAGNSRLREPRGGTRS